MKKLSNWKQILYFNVSHSSDLKIIIYLSLEAYCKPSLHNRKEFGLHKA